MKQVKPLPAPLDGQRKKRGGRRWGPGTRWDEKGRGSPSQLTPLPRPRYRKMKERLGLTEIRKQANRMSFGEVTPPYLAPPHPLHCCGRGNTSASSRVPWPPLCPSPRGISPHLLHPAVQAFPGPTPARPRLPEHHPAGPAGTSLRVVSENCFGSSHGAGTHTHTPSAQAVVTGPLLLTGAPARLTALRAQAVLDGMEPWAD